jgi:hypothetical protein
MPLCVFRTQASLEKEDANVFVSIYQYTFSMHVSEFSKKYSRFESICLLPVSFGPLCLG